MSEADRNIHQGLKMLAEHISSKVEEALETQGAHQPGLVRGLVRYIISTEKSWGYLYRISPGDLVTVFDSINRGRFTSTVVKVWSAYGYSMVQVKNPDGVMDWYPTRNCSPVES